MNRRRFWSGFFLVAAILTAVMIFCFSAQNGDTSQALSDGVTVQMARIVRPDYESMSAPERFSLLELLSTIIRKCAHFCEYALLGFNLAAHLRLRRPQQGPRAAGLAAWGVATLYAATDELHQLFVSARSAQVVDVLIDSAGSLTGILVATLAMALLRKPLERLV